MSSTVYAPFSLELPRLRWQLALAIASVGACALVPWLMYALPVAARAAFSAAGLTTSLIGLRRAGWLPPAQCLAWTGGEWRVTHRAGRLPIRALEVEARCFRHFIWLRLGVYALLIGPGDLDTEPFRRLQVVLRRPAPASLREHVA